ncbi:MAG: T9SS type A sorting domain-containing protein, partial [bacterium]
PDNGFIKLIIYDISGREIELLVNEYKIRGQYRINFNSNKYSSGVYFYSLIADRKIVKTNKLLVVK